MPLVEIEPNRWVVQKRSHAPARSTLPVPNIISDIMPETEQVDGRFYTSKRAFRAVGRVLGLTEIGNEKFKPKQRATTDPKVKETRRMAIRKAVERHKSGQRPVNK